MHLVSIYICFGAVSSIAGVHGFAPVHVVRDTKNIAGVAVGSSQRSKKTHVLQASSAEQQFDRYLQQQTKTHECLQLLKDGSVEIDSARASDLLTQVGNTVMQSSAESSEDDLSVVYDELRRRGILKGYGSVTQDVLPVPAVDKSMSVARLETLTSMNMRSLAPGSSDRTWLYAGAVICLIEYIVSQNSGVDPLQVAIPSTLALLALDRIALKGAVVETACRTLLPNYKEKIVRHEAGHFLLAYLMGLPVSGCLLDPWKVREFVNGQAGTVFADPAFARGMQTGSLPKSIVDRFSIILMAGIASEAISFGNAQGGSSDEAALIDVLSSIKPAFTYEQIKRQARWAAVQGVLLLREHKDAYNALIDKLRNDAPLGECVLAIETALAKQQHELPVDARRRALRADGSPETAELRQLLEQRLNAALNQTTQDQQHELRALETAQIHDELQEIEVNIKASSTRSTNANASANNNAAAISQSKAAEIEARLLQVEERLQQISALQNTE